MPKKRDKTVAARAKKDKAAGKSASTQAGEYVRDEIDRVRAGQHGVRNAKQAIAIGLSKARRAGVKLAPPKKGRASKETIAKAKQDSARGGSKRAVNPKRSRATSKALKREGTAGASHAALSRQAKSASRSRTSADRSAPAKRAVSH